MTAYTSSDFDINKLGSFYEKDKTIFRVFAPNSSQVYLVINEKEYKMHQVDKCFEIALGGNLQGIRYYYKNDLNMSYTDPFSYLSNDKYSYVIDKQYFNYDVVKPDEINDILIYETSVRDFTSNKSYTGKYHKTFLGLTEDNLLLEGKEIGLNYLKKLGISHLQLLPIFAFDLDKSDYNWGYNPLAYNYVHKDYVYDDNKLYAYINEFRNVVNALHKHNIRVTLDVVFNHVYEKSTFNIDKMLGGTFFRKLEDGTYAKGTLCGNEVKSEDPFVRAYIAHMCKRYIELFDIDGLRFDLMGILDYETINLVKEECTKLKNDFIVYGEGWDMGDVLSKDKRASIINADKLPGVMMFNDFYRDTIINYVSGNDSIRQDVKDAIANSSYLNSEQSINFVECHDNLTFYDRVSKYIDNATEQDKAKRCKLALAIVMLSRGIPFIHSGQEFLRTKKLVENSYNAGDDINSLDWNLRVKNDDCVNYFIDLVNIRKQYKESIKNAKEAVFEDYYDCILYKLDDLFVIVNPCQWDYLYQDENEYEVIFDINGKNSYISKVLSIPAYSILICKR